MSELIDKAIIYATGKHSAQTRKYTGAPYILHPLEVAVIISTLTDDECTIAAGILHDTVEDTDATVEEISSIFGKRVTELVLSETEDKYAEKPPQETWEQRKMESLEKLKNSDDIEIKKLWLGDKLSNVRSFCRMYSEVGDKMWQSFNQKDKTKQARYYKAIAEGLSELSLTPAYKELVVLTEKLFGGNL